MRALGIELANQDISKDVLLTGVSKRTLNAGDKCEKLKGYKIRIRAL